MDLYWIIWGMFGRSFPHTRGDGPGKGITEIFTAMFTPHTWGWTLLALGYMIFIPVFPTHVGMDLDY